MLLSLQKEANQIWAIESYLLRAQRLCLIIFTELLLQFRPQTEQYLFAVTTNEFVLHLD